jgi:hypothetical protein
MIMNTQPLENRLIAHSGGGINNSKYTNSLEAITFSSDYAELIEVDVVLCKDALIVAHDGLEKNYGFKINFAEIEVNEFLAAKYAGKFTTLSFEQLVVFAVSHDVKFIIDIKEKDEIYDKAIEIINSICLKYSAFDKIIVQVYEPRDYDTVAQYPFFGVFVVMWKNYGNLFSKYSLDYIEHCFLDKRIPVRGLSIYYINRQNKKPNIDLAEFNTYLNKDVMIYFHGHKKEDEQALLERGFGIFTHYVAEYADS